ncbi:High mobility group box domain, partial [Trinorchestia longiramus]
MALPANYRQAAMLASAVAPTPSTPPPSSSSTTPSSSSSLVSSSSTGSGSSSNTVTTASAATSTSSSKSKERVNRPGGTPSSVGGKSGSGGGVGSDSNVPSPFTTPSHGNPAFAPQKMGGASSGSKGSSSGSDSRSLPKPPKGPDKPLMPYMRYSRKVWDQVKAANQDLKLWEIGKIIGSMWRDLPEADKQDFVDEYEAEKAEYQKNLEIYHQSAAYQQYVAAKAKAAAGAAAAVKEDAEAAAAAAAERSASAAAGAPTHTATKLDRRIDIQPAEDEEDYDDSVTLKHLSHARYVRNHRLINEVFSDTMVPDVRSVVTSQRLTVLRRQVQSLTMHQVRTVLLAVPHHAPGAYCVAGSPSPCTRCVLCCWQSLTMHQKKLENELLQIEEKFDAKKRKFLEAGDAFQSELKRVKSNAPKLDDAYFASLVEREKENLKREGDDRQRQQQLSQGGSSAVANGATSPASQPPPPEPTSSGPAATNNATLVDNASEPQQMQADGLKTEEAMGHDSKNPEDSATNGVADVSMKSLTMHQVRTVLLAVPRHAPGAYCVAGSPSPCTRCVLCCWQSLIIHQKKLENELLQIEEKFDAKKRKFLEAGDAFQSELKRVK